MNQNKKIENVLVVEDKNSKFTTIQSLLFEVFGGSINVQRCEYVFEAQKTIEQNTFDLIVLDVSMDIVESGSTGKNEGHAVLGGMLVLEHMYLLEIERPTVIVTGFDYFVSKSPNEVSGEGKTIQDISNQARHFLGDYMLGCIKSGNLGWEKSLKSIFEGAV